VSLCETRNVLCPPHNFHQSTARGVVDVDMNFLLFYLLIGVICLLADITAACRFKNTTLRDQMKASLFLAGDDLMSLTLSMGLYIVAWPVIFILRSGGPPTREG
jgi:hypothetical protein